MNKDAINTTPINLTTDPYSWVEINRSAFLNNLAIVRNLIGPDCVFGFVAKANAYGHGIVELCKEVDRSAFVDYICVSSLSEAFKIRAAGVKKQILVLAILDQPIELVLFKNIDLVAYSKDILEKINNVAALFACKVNVHIKIDTGLSRLGFAYDDPFLFTDLLNYKNLNIVGVFTHFAESDNKDVQFTQLQIKRFKSVLDSLSLIGISPKFIHCANSSAVARASKEDIFDKNSYKLNLTDIPFNFVRIGGLCYGLSKSNKIDDIVLNKTGKYLQQILSLKAKIIQIKHVKAGEFIGYSKTAMADRDLTLAVIPIGYADGYPRGLSNKGVVYIGQNKLLAKVIGRISMNMTTLDVTNLNVQIGDVVELIGCRPGIYVKDLSAATETIDYEVTTRINIVNTFYF